MNPSIRIWAALTALVAAGLAGPAWAQQTTVAQNLCRAACGEAWIADHACTPPPGLFNPPSKAVCQKRAEKKYDRCLAACVVAEPPAPAGAAMVRPDEAPHSTPAAKSK